MLITIDPSRDVPLFQQLVAAIRAEVAEGRLVVGTRLPAARELAGALDVNVHTVLRAYQELRDEGLLDLRRGRGAIVTDRAAQLVDIAADVERLVRRARELGMSGDTLGEMVKEALR